MRYDVALIRGDEEFSRALASVLGRAFRPLADAAGHDVRAPGRAELDLFDPLAVGAAVRDVDAVLHLATRIQPLHRMQQPDTWRENDRLRAEASVASYRYDR